jgi:O-acetyl-ADP-ribose deacetylase (regulator of RNase III)
MSEAARLNVKTIAFPSISTGAYRFPVDRAARIAAREIQEGLARHSNVEKVVMVCFDSHTFKAYQQAFGV